MKPISKSQFNTSLQCHKAFWLYRHRRDLQVFSATQEKVMSQGTSFGEYMQQLFSGGVDINKKARQFGEKISLTKELLKEGKQPIYEATLAAYKAGVPLLCMVDILVPTSSGWEIYEVKSSTKVKPEHITDVAFQKYVAEQMGLRVDAVYVVHVNNQYTRIGALDVEKMGWVANIDEQVEELAIDFDREIESLQFLDQGSEPEVTIGPHCHKPYECGFRNYCWRDVPRENAVIDFFSDAKAFSLMEKGYYTLDSIPEDYSFTGKTAQRFNGWKKGEIQIDKVGVQSFLGKLEYPLNYLDFETFMSAIPKFDHSRPYQQICFQYSLHIQDAPKGNCHHKEFLDSAEGADPRIPFIENLIKDIKRSGSVVTYNASFEKSCLEGIAENFPQYAEDCHQIIHRIIDLYEPFRDLLVYHPSMEGSASIKAVLPALIPELSYSEMEIANGGTAMEVFENMINNTHTPAEKQNLRQALLEYCKLDTWAMVKLVEWLQLNC